MKTVPRYYNFVTTNEELANAFEKRLERLEALDIRASVACQDFATFTPNGPSLLVTPGNSFGHMTGGFDGAVVKRFTHQGDVDAAMRKLIVEGWGGELPVGSALMLPVNDPIYHGVIYAPTMRIPHELPEGTDAAYTATWAALNCFSHTSLMDMFTRRKAMDPAMAITLTGMGTSTGLIPAEVAAEHMILAIERFHMNIEIDNLWTDGFAHHTNLTTWKR